MSGVEGIMEEVKLENLKGYVLPAIDFEEINFVGKSTMTEKEAESTVKKVKELYSSKNLTRVGWIVGPSSKPDNLSDILVSNGFNPHIEIWGMARSMSKPLDIKINQKFEYREIQFDEITPELTSMGDQAYGMPEGSSAMFLKLMESIMKKYKITMFYAFVGDKPVGFGNLVQLGNEGYLGGAATLPEYRKQGIYSGMLKKRYDVAKEAGLNNLVINAKELTSAPVAKSHGFEKMIDLSIYMWLNE